MLPPKPLLNHPFLKLFFQGHLQFIHAFSTPLERSRHLRAALMECLRDVADGAPSEDADLRAALTVWSFVEAVYLAPSSHSSHAPVRLADWHALRSVAVPTQDHNRRLVRRASPPLSFYIYLSLYLSLPLAHTPHLSRNRCRSLGRATIQTLQR